MVGIAGFVGGKYRFGLCQKEDFLLGLCGRNCTWFLVTDLERGIRVEEFWSGNICGNYDDCDCCDFERNDWHRGRSCSSVNGDMGRRSTYNYVLCNGSFSGGTGRGVSDCREEKVRKGDNSLCTVSAHLVSDQHGTRNSGSYSIEAAVLVPLFLFVFVVAVQLAISLYQEIVHTEIYQSNLWAVGRFYDSQGWKEIWEELTDDES